MPKLVGFLISPRQQRMVGFLTGLVLFAALLLAGTLLASSELHIAMHGEAERLLSPYQQTRAHVDAAFKQLKRQVTGAPCSDAFRQKLQQVAFLPDGLNQFYYAPHGVVECSANVERFDPPVALGEPDYTVGENGMHRLVWHDRELAGLEGLSATIILDPPFAIAVPRHARETPPSWLRFEILFSGKSGRKVHDAGETGLFERVLQGSGGLFSATPRPGQVQCAPGVCVATEASVAAFLLERWQIIGAALALAVLIAAAAARHARQFVMRRWSFEARFRRHFDTESLICAYQPIMDLQTGQTIGCEVLARWRDVDDSIVYPDRFIPFVDRFGMTLAFTRAVVEKAYCELSTCELPRRPFKVTFNIFPRDLHAETFIDMFGKFLAERDRFQVVAEIVESESIDIARARREIERLRQAGIKAYIDDFGTGYSCIHNLAALGVDGAKLDRAFAMAPEGSIMARILPQAAEMVRSSGCSLVVEGIECKERLAQLRAIEPPIEFAQGYLFSRPVEIAGLRTFLLGDLARTARPAGPDEGRTAVPERLAATPQRPSAQAQPSAA